MSQHDTTPARADGPLEEAPPGHLTRRRVFAAGGAGALAAGAAACGTSNKSGSGTAKASHGSGGPIAKLSDIQVGSAISAKDGDGKPVIVARPTAGSVACFSAICTHRGCTVAPHGAKLICPCHGSQYNALTGAVEHGPAPKPLKKVPVKLKGQEVVES